MRTQLLITDLTRMQGNSICIAGVSVDGTCVRPELPRGRITESWLRVVPPKHVRTWHVSQLIRPFVDVELDLRTPRPDPPHTEDWIVSPIYSYVTSDVLIPDVRDAVLASLDDGAVADIFGTEIHTGPGWYVLAGNGTRSLGTVVPQAVEHVDFGVRENGRYDYRLTFTDRAGCRYTLAVVDLAFRHYLRHLQAHEGHPVEECAAALTHTLRVNRVYLRIGLARGWERYPDRCYLQITGVYSFPDYLGGRCFADFPFVAAK